MNPRAIVPLALGVLAACGRDTPRPTGAEWFADVTEESGVDFVHDAGRTTDKHLPETMGAGGALLDADEDGDLDLYLVQGGPMRLAGAEPGTFAEPTGPLPANRLFLNDGRGHFTDVTPASGAAAHTGYGMGVVTGDVNGDGHADLYVTNLGRDVLLLGDGRGSFRDATNASLIREERWTTGACLFDADGDRDLDLYVAAYVLIDLAHPTWCGLREPGWRSYCHPDHYAALEDRFWRNRGDGTFEDATASAGLARAAGDGGKGLGVIACDVDDDGDQDLYVANDSTENWLWLNDGHGHFEDGTLLSGVGVDRLGRTEAGMGLASGDVDLDLDLDLLVTNFDDESDTLYLNLGGALFEDRTVEAGLEAPSFLPVGFGCVLEDFDLDGDLDLAVANGHIIDNIELYHDGKTHAQRALLFENQGDARFRDVSAESGDLCATPFVGRGLYAGDVDLDGDADLVLTQCGGPARVFENLRGDGRPSVTVAGLPRGTRIEFAYADGRRIAREVGPPPSYLGQSAPDVIVGTLGEALIEIAWRVPGSGDVRQAMEPPLARGRIDFEREAAGWRPRVTRP